MSTDSRVGTRPLPERPNLCHLKDQAKDLLKSGAASSLADAQFSRGPATRIFWLGVVGLGGFAGTVRVAIRTALGGIVTEASWNHCGDCVTGACTMVVAPIIIVKVAPAIRPSI